jgi:DNA-binding NarL/FixJ family response regulator
LLADDHAIVRYGLRAMVESQPGMQVCAEAATGAEAIEEAKRSKPDLIVLDLTLAGDLNGLQVLEAVKAEMPETEVLILTMHFSEDVARESLRMGAIGYVLKSDADEELLAAIDSARHGHPFFTGRLAMTMAENFISPRELTPEERGEFPLTPREMQVIQLLAMGRSNKETATELKVSTRTIESHRHHIMRKMSFQSFSDLVRFAIRQDLVKP